MDNTKEFILKCEKAWEIQEYWRTEATTGDFTNKGVICSFEEYHNDDTYDFGFGDTDIRITNAKNLIWLPRQDQLQKMIDLNYFSLIIKYTDKWEIGDYDFDGYFDTVFKADSLEQLWLTFVMSEKYNKIWNGKDWIKEAS